ncbi:transcriptional regulator containing PAS, AAA-type ATPase, and DNA-binding domains [Desulfosporosinus orientis DSM 765]|uniref:Transcriptional regulator containing PAS, AAA-type ATPase, and DNA-binding domains n=1 Tax=Desulfosporosinus orientis (strain ATCC 19365 / DSM 765 / NCIMB 8382 / VKM B-1628 / Singapore I) TaxID=768706 RepID=G7WIY4_DESOD|nr:sigma 54-interacting transcriptional regulator [Desulfosporosinus orientis]AET69709.1 transcriptional regulator containing PAS, AAA-type ATPase, and DNA-binding domains [Desulfosporosinus orientis DSM 765]
MKIDDQLNSEILDRILGTLREGVNIVDANGIIVYANHSSANYVGENVEMIGKHITEFYPKAALLEVMATHQPVFDKKIVHDADRIYIVNATPLYIGEKFSGGIATFRDITEIERLSKRLENLEMELALNRMNDDVFESIVGKEGSLKEARDKAQRSIASLGGPRHSVIVGETGTGKTMLAKAMYKFAEKIGVIKPGSPFIEVNCAQFTNADIAAMEVFGTEKGSFTGAYEKPGLIEIANGGILFLDEAQSLGTHQTMLLKVIESGMVRRIGGRTERNVNIIIITASSKNLKKEFIPELYQRLAQYQIELPPLKERCLAEKESLLNSFVSLYQWKAKSRYNISLKVVFSEAAKNILLKANYERNIRQFRDVVNASIDAAAPLISNLSRDTVDLKVSVDEGDLPYGMFIEDKNEEQTEEVKVQPDQTLEQLIKQLNEEGLGPRKIATELKKRGIQLEYYQIAYRLKNGMNEEKSNAGNQIPNKIVRNKKNQKAV